MNWARQLATTDSPCFPGVCSEPVPFFHGLGVKSGRQGYCNGDSAPVPYWLEGFCRRNRNDPRFRDQRHAWHSLRLFSKQKPYTILTHPNERKITDASPAVFSKEPFESCHKPQDDAGRPRKR